MQVSVAQFLQDLQSHAMALRQRGCERIVDFIRHTSAFDAKPILTDELLRKMAALVTDVSPQTSTLAMEFIELLFERIPTDPEEEDAARMLMPSLVLVGMMMDALMCRLADAKIQIRSKAKAVLAVMAAKTDATTMLHKLSTMSNSRNIYMKRNILELMTEIVRSRLSLDEVLSTQRDIAHSAALFLSDSDGGVQELAYVLVDATVRGMSNNAFLVLLQDLGVKSDICAKLQFKYAAPSTTTTTTSAFPGSTSKVESTIPAAFGSASFAAAEVKETKTASSNATANALAYVPVTPDTFDVRFLCSSIVDVSSLSAAQFVGHEQYMPATAITLRSETELLQMLDRLAVELLDDEDWQRRVQALVTLGNFAWGSLWDSVQPAFLLRKLQDGLDLQLGDLRSMIIKEVCKCLSILAYQWKTKQGSWAGFTPLLDVFWPKLLKLLVSKTQIIASSADIFLRHCFYLCEDGKVFHWLHDMMRSKNGILHKHAMEYLLLSLLRHPAEALDKPGVSVQILGSILLGIKGANAEARKVARVIYRWLQSAAASGKSSTSPYYRGLFQRLEQELLAMGSSTSILKQLQTEERGFLTPDMMQFIQQVPFSLYYLMLQQQQSSAGADAVASSSSSMMMTTTMHDVEKATADGPFLGMMDDDQFDWMAAALEDDRPAAPSMTTTTVAKAAAAPRMSVLGGGAMRGAAAVGPSNMNTNTNMNSTGATSSTNSLLLGGARRMSMMPSSSASSSSSSSNAMNGFGMMAGGARRVSMCLPPPAAASLLSSSSASSSFLSSSVSSSGTLPSFVANAAGGNARSVPPSVPMPIATEDEEEEEKESAIIGSNSMGAASVMPVSSTTTGLRDGPKRVLHPVSTTTTMSAPVGGPWTTTTDAENCAPHELNVALHKAPAAAATTTTLKKTTTTNAMNTSMSMSKVDAFKESLKLTASLSGRSRALDVYWQNLQQPPGQVDMDVLASGWGFVLDCLADSNSKIFGEAIRNLDAFFQLPSAVVHKHLAPTGTSSICSSSSSSSSSSSNNHNLYNHPCSPTSMLSVLLTKLFAGLVDAKPLAKEAISRFTCDLRRHFAAVVVDEDEEASSSTGNNNTNKVHGDKLLLRHTMHRLRDLPERALAAAFQFAGALLPPSIAASSSSTTAEAMAESSFVTEVLLRVLHVLVPGSVSLHELQDTATFSSSSSSSSSLSSVNASGVGANEGKKPSPVAMLAGKRFTVRFYETIDAASSSSSTSLFFRAVATLSIAQQSALKSLMVSVMTGSSFDVKLAQQIKREKQLLLKKLSAAASSSSSSSTASSTATTTSGGLNAGPASTTTTTERSSSVLANLALQLSTRPSAVADALRSSPLVVKERDTSLSSSSPSMMKIAPALESLVQEVCRSPSVLSRMVPSKPPSPACTVDANAAVSSPVVVVVAADDVEADNESAPVDAFYRRVQSASPSTSPSTSSSSTASTAALVSSPISLTRPFPSPQQQPHHHQQPPQSPVQLAFSPATTRLSPPPATLSSSSSSEEHFVLSSSPSSSSSSSSPSCSCSSPATAAVVVVEVSPASAVDFASVKQRLLRLVDATTDATVDAYLDSLRVLSSLGLTQPVQCVESLLLLVELCPTLARVSKSNNHNNDEQDETTLLRATHAQLRQLLATMAVDDDDRQCSADMATSILDKVVETLSSLSDVAVDDVASSKALGAWDSMLIEVARDLCSSLDDGASSTSLARYFLHQVSSNDAAIRRAAASSSSTRRLPVVSVLVLAHLVWAHTATNLLHHRRRRHQQHRRGQEDDNVDEDEDVIDDEDAMWKAIVQWIIEADVLGHGVSLVRQQAIVCLARVVVFYQHHATAPRRERCVHWLMPLSTVHRKLLMVYVEKFRPEPQQQQERRRLVMPSSH